MKLLPVAVNVVGLLPAKIADGEILLRVGVAAATVKLRTFDVQFPSEALETVMGRVATWLTSALESCTLTCVLLMKVVGRPLPLTIT